MESDSDDARPAKTDTPGTQPGGKLRVERDQAVDWPQLVRRCEELQLGARELELDHSLDEELAAIAASKQQSRYKQKRRNKLRKQVLRAIAHAETALIEQAIASAGPAQCASAAAAQSSEPMEAVTGSIYEEGSAAGPSGHPSAARPGRRQTPAGDRPAIGGATRGQTRHNNSKLELSCCGAERARERHSYSCTCTIRVHVHVPLVY